MMDEVKNKEINIEMTKVKIGGPSGRGGESHAKIKNKEHGVKCYMCEEYGHTTRNCKGRVHVVAFLKSEGEDSDDYESISEIRAKRAKHDDVNNCESGMKIENLRLKIIGVDSI